MFLMKVTHVGANSSLAQIIKLVQNAQTNKAPIQLLADTISSYFVPSVVTVALVVFIAWYITGVNGYVTLPAGARWRLGFVLSQLLILVRLKSVCFCAYFCHLGDCYFVPVRARPCHANGRYGRHWHWRLSGCVEITSYCLFIL